MVHFAELTKSTPPSSEAMWCALWDAPNSEEGSNIDYAEISNDGDGLIVGDVDELPVAAITLRSSRNHAVRSRTYYQEEPEQHGTPTETDHHHPPHPSKAMLGCATYVGSLRGALA